MGTLKGCERVSGPPRTRVTAVARSTRSKQSKERSVDLGSWFEEIHSIIAEKPVAAGGLISRLHSLLPGQEAWGGGGPRE